MTTEELEALRLKRIDKYAKEIETIFNKAATEAASIGQLFSSTDLFSKPFSFSDYPITKDRVDKLMKSMSQSIEATVVNGVTAEWKNSNFRNDEIAQSILGFKPDDEPNTGKFKKYFNNNNDALQAFLKRKDYGLSLSDRVWKYTEKFKSEIELGLDTGIRAGLPASEMARDLKQYLQYPDKLFRRVRDQHGNLQLSKAAAKFHPGQGVYRSSYKNAMRLTRTETNMAYHAANYERHQQWDFIVGIEVRLTNNPGHVADICDELKGKYPKTFKFTGWHPHCMCHTVTILKTQAEIDADVEKITNGEQTDGASRNAVKEMPGNFKRWAEANHERIATAKNMPYFIKDNFTGTDTSKWFIKPVEPAKVVSQKVEAKPDANEKIIEKARMEMAGFTMSRDEKMAFFNYTASDYTKINEYLRNPDGVRITERRTDIIKTMDGVMQRAPKVNGTSYRGIARHNEAGFNTYKNLKVGDIYTEKGYLSTTYNKNEIGKFTEGGKYKIEMTIKGKNGVLIEDFSQTKKEAEILFSRNSKFKVISTRSQDGILKIELEEITTKTAAEKSSARIAARTPEQRAAIQQAWDARKAATQKSQVDIPVELRDGGIYFNGTNIKINEEIFKLLDEKRPVQLVIHKTDGSQFSPNSMQVRLQNGTRQAKSAWEREAVVYHEYGHAIDHQRGLRWNNDTRDIMSKWKVKMAEKVEYKKSVKLWDYDTQKYVTITKTVKAPLAAQITDRITNICLKWQRMDEKTFLAKGVAKADMIEQLSSLADTIKSLNIRYGGGHTTAYFKTPGLSQAEFIAHAFENKFIGNYMFKKLAPELYQDMIDYIEKMIK